MISLRLLTLGQRQPAWVEAGFREYQRRLSGSVRLELVEVALPKRKPGTPVAVTREREAEQLRRHCSVQAVRVALDVTGRPISTEQLSQQLSGWLDLGQDVDLLVGGPDGLARTLRDEAGLVWSLSALTFPHGLVRVIVAEQVYRAWSILQGHPYHRG